MVNPNRETKKSCEIQNNMIGTRDFTENKGTKNLHTMSLISKYFFEIFPFPINSFNYNKFYAAHATTYNNFCSLSFQKIHLAFDLFVRSFLNK